MNVAPVSFNTNNYNTQKCRKPCFQANLTPKLKENLILQAKNSGKLMELIDQFKNIKCWGKENSFIQTSLDLDASKESLTLFNPQKSLYYSGDLEVKSKDSLLKQFLSLTKAKILKAEKNIDDTVELNTNEAIDKIVKSPKAMKKLTGSENPYDEDLAREIERLSEKELIEYRFGLWDMPESKIDDEFMNAIKGGIEK